MSEKLSEQDKIGYIEAISKPLFNQAGWKQLEAKKLGVLRINLITRYRDGELDKDTYKELDDYVKETMGLEVN
jgi:hypothetical protein